MEIGVLVVKVGERIKVTSSVRTIKERVTSELIHPQKAPPYALTENWSLFPVLCIFTLFFMRWSDLTRSRGKQLEEVYWDLE